MGWLRQRKDIEKPKVRKKPSLPKGIEKTERGYRVIGMFSVHRTLEKALKQQEGMKNAN